MNLLELARIEGEPSLEDFLKAGEQAYNFTKKMDRMSVIQKIAAVCLFIDHIAETTGIERKDILQMITDLTDAANKEQGKMYRVGLQEKGGMPGGTDDEPDAGDLTEEGN